MVRISFSFAEMTKISDVFSLIVSTHKVSAHNATTVPHFCFVPSCKRFTELFSFSVGRARTDDRSSQHSDDEPAPVLITWISTFSIFTRPIP